MALVACGEQKPAPPSTADAAKAQAESDTKAKAATEATAKEQEALKAGVEAVVYGLPLVIMDITKNKTTNDAGNRADQCFMDILD